MRAPDKHILSNGCQFKNPVMKEFEEENLDDFEDNVGELSMSISQFGFPTTVDDDRASFVFEKCLYRVTESDGSVTISVIRSGNLDSKVSVEYLTKDGTAIGQLDYVPKQGVLDFASGQTERQITISIEDDDEEELDEYFKVQIFNPSAGAKLGAKRITVVTIIDDERLEHRSHQMISFISFHLWNETHSIFRRGRAPFIRSDAAAAPRRGRRRRSTARGCD